MKQQVSLHNLPFACVCSVLVFVAMASAATIPAAWADPTTVEVTYSHRQVSGTPVPDPDIIEGSIIATFTGNNPIILVEPDTTMVQISDTEFEYIFVWDEDEPKVVTFRDELHNEIEVTAFPEPIYPFDPANHWMHVVHVTTEPANLWDPEIGIYVWGNYENCMQHGSEWERQATIDIYDPEDNLVTSREVGIRINGASSRSLAQKSLRVYFDHIGPAEVFNYDLFDSEPSTFKRVLLFGAGVLKQLFNDNSATGLFLDLGHLASRRKLATVYINGEYWGYQYFRERIDDEFTDHTYGLEGQDYILVKDGGAEHGDWGEWNAFLDIMNEPQDYSSHEFFQTAVSQLDLDAYIDWLFINIFGASADNGHHWNYAALKVGTGPWEFIMWDEGAYQTWSNLEADFFRFYSAGNEAEFLEYFPPAYYSSWSPWLQRRFSIFHNLMQNAEFRYLFFTRVDELLANQMSVSALLDRLAALEAEHMPEIAMCTDRSSWNSVNSYVSNLSTTRNWIIDRHPIVVAQKADFMAEHRAEVELTQFSATDEETHVRLQWRTEAETNNRGFVVYRSVGNPDGMIEIASYLSEPELVGQMSSTTPTVYEFVDGTADPARTNYYQLHHVNTADEVTVHNWIESTWVSPWLGLTVNELMADNKTSIVDGFSEYDDWIELHNSTADPISLNGLYVTDDLDNPIKFQLTGDLTVPAYGYLLLWADDQTDTQGAGHCAFKLSAGGEEFGVFEPDGLTLIDGTSFGDQLPDVSYARYPNATGPWAYAANVTPGTENVSPGTELVLTINEVMSNNVTTITDELGEYDPWLEIYNPLPISVELGGLTLTDNIGMPHKWALPSQTLAGGQHVLIWADAQTEQGLLHTNFLLGTTSGNLALYSTLDSSFCDIVAYPALAPDLAYARVPDGSAEWEITAEATPGQPNPSGYTGPVLFINEFMAANDTAIPDEFGEYDDWLEIYNPGPDPVELGGLFLTDELIDSTQWELPDTTLYPEDHLLIWCDEDMLQGPLHANFKLSSSGEEIGLFDRTSNGNALIDNYQFGPQSGDISEGRQTDGGLPWILFAEPTPGETNNSDVAAPPSIPARIRLLPNRPNPFNPRTTICFSIPEPGPVRLQIFDATGRRVCTLLSARMSAGWHERVWSGTDAAGIPVASGIYYYRLNTAGEARTQKMLLIK